MTFNTLPKARTTVPHRRRAMAAAGVVLTVSVAAATLIASNGSAAGAPDAQRATPAALPATALTVDVTRPQRRSMDRTLPAGGSIAAREELVIGSDAAGLRLLEVRVDVGSAVRRGDLLARGDDAQLLAQAEANFERADRIRDSGVYSPEALQTRRTAAEAAAARLELALAQAAELDVRLAQARVHAPASGVIVRRNATVGSVMQPGLELFRLIRDDEIEWQAELPDQLLGQVKVGGTALVRIDGTRRVEGRVRRVAPTVDPRTRNGLVHVSLPRGTALKAGGHAQGELRIGSTEVLTLPESALLARDGQAFVYVIGAHGTARATRVQTGTRQDGWVEVSGLPADATVVSTGAGFVKDGERVRVAATSQGGRS